MNFLFFFAVLVSQSVAADHSEVAPVKTSTISSSPASAPQKTAPDCNYENAKKKGAASLESVLSSLKAEEKPKQVFMEPTARTTTSVTYRFPEITLKPGESLYFSVPEDLQKGPVSFVVLGHRQDPSTHKGGTGGKWDEVPGLTSFQVHAKNFPKEKAWRYWTGMSSGDKGAKFAEPRNSLELENLYEWTTYGSTGVAQNDSSHELLQPDALRVISVGKDDVKVGQITLKIRPPKPDQLIEQVFTPGSQFNSTIGDKAKFGGGQATEGTFPNALVLGFGGDSHTKLPEGWKKVSSNTVAIPVPPGKRITSVEVIGGDSHPDKTKNKDGGWGTPGWSRLSVGTGTSPQNANWFLQDENVPPEGLMIASPKDCNQVTQDGDYVFVRGSDDNLYVMGIRVGLMNK